MSAELLLQLAELTFATGTSCRDRMDASLAKIRAGIYTFAYMTKEEIARDAAEQIVCMMLLEADELEAIAAELCDSLDELVPDETYADWVESRTSLAELGYTREKLLELRRKHR